MTTFQRTTVAATTIIFPASAFFLPLDQHCHQPTQVFQNSWDTSGDSAPNPYSVGDYVQGVHGGKYQFEQAGGATFAGRQFAESLYSEENSQEDALEALLKEPLPGWAQRMGTSTKLGSSAVIPMERFPVLSLSKSNSSPATISITNDERSWEYYFSKIVQVAKDGTVLDDTISWCHEDSAPLLVSPAVGHLAPRGGSSNLCDPSKPYSDSATIQVQAKTDIMAIDAINDNSILLVVGTEAEVWYYWIQMTQT